MSNIFIKPKNPVWTKNLYCSITLNKNQVDYGDLRSQLKKKGFREQVFRHITILSVKHGDKIKNVLGKLSPKERKKIIKKIKLLSEKLKWEYKQKEIYLVNKKSHFGKLKTLEHIESYIRVIEMPDIDIFYKRLNKLLHLNIPNQFTHITLFTKGERPSPDYYGISIPSKSAFRKLNPKKVN